MPRWHLRGTRVQLMDQILAKLHRRKEFYTVVALIAVILMILRYFVLPPFNPVLEMGWLEVIAEFSDKLLISLIVTVFVGSFVFWLTPEVMRNAKVEVIEPREISTLFNTALHTSNVWWYSGGCGRYFRAKTLPEMAKEARRNSLTREVNGLILDPRNESLCEEYASYRRGVRSATQENPWTVKRVRKELVATIIKTAIIQHEEPLLRIKLSLINHFSSIRFDMSSLYVVLTKEDKSAPAIRLDEGTYFYQWYRDEMVLAEKQASQPPGFAQRVSLDEVTATHISDYIPLLGLPSEYLNPQDLEDVLGLIRTTNHPYE